MEGDKVLRKFLLGSFEQNTNGHLPFVVERVVRQVARNFSVDSADSSAIYLRQIEFAHVTLHMRLYQRFGIKSNQTIDLAHLYLDKLLTTSREPARSPTSAEIRYPVATVSST